MILLPVNLDIQVEINLLVTGKKEAGTAKIIKSFFSLFAIANVFMTLSLACLRVAQAN
jgi:hypothetical protein